MGPRWGCAVSIASPYLPRVDCSRGAPMGRHDFMDDHTAPGRRFTLLRVPMIDGGAYDEGGAYWGTGAPLYCCRSTDRERWAFLRTSAGRAAAKAEFSARWPGIRWAGP